MTISHRISLLCASVLLATLQIRAADESLPKVKIAQDGRSFETEAGKPFVPFGVNYYRPGKPVVLAEFGWYGGAQKPTFDRGVHPIGTEEQQAKYLRRAVETSAGFVVGWLNWGFYDYPGARDCSELTGLLHVDGTPKAWGKTFKQLSARYSGQRISPARIGPRPALDWEACITDAAAANQSRSEYLKAFLADKPRYN